jgi:hypothetical protein
VVGAHPGDGPGADAVERVGAGAPEFARGRAEQKDTHHPRVRWQENRHPQDRPPEERAVMGDSGTIDITSFERWGEQGWRWTATVTYPDGTTLEHDSRTNEDAEGLFGRDQGEGAWSQSLGVLQFSLDPDDEAKARKAVVAMYARQMRSPL